MGKMAFAVLFSFALAGCATQPQGHWHNPDITNAQAQSLAYDCSVIARSMHRGNGLAAEIYAQEEFKNCMRSKGFYWVAN